MLWWLHENGDLIENDQQPPDKKLWNKTLAAQAFGEGLCPTCFLEGKVIVLKWKFTGLGWSNSKLIYYCPVCSFSRQS